MVKSGLKYIKSRILGLSALLAIALAAGTLVLWMRSYRTKEFDQISWATAQARYTLRSDRGRMVLRAPPVASAEEERAAEEWARDLRNGDGQFWVSLWSNEALVFPSIPWFPVQPAGLKPEAARRALLRALEDHARFVAAHALLTNESRADYHIRWQQLYIEWDGLKIEHELPDTDHRYVFGGTGIEEIKFSVGDKDADPAQIPALVRQWHHRLDERVVGVPYGVVLAIFRIAPGLWCWRWWRRRTALRRGLCPYCRYDLRASKDVCPECGRAIEGRAPAAAEGEGGRPERDGSL